MKPTRLFLAAVGFVLATSAFTQAATVFATLQSKDRILGFASGSSPSAYPQYFTDVIDAQNFVGTAGTVSTNLTNSAFVLGFQLPTLLPGQSITAATFRIAKTGNTGSMTVNLSGLATDAPTTADFYQGATGNPGDTLIEDDFSLASATVGTQQTADALAFVLSRYLGLNPIGTGEAFFRLNSKTVLPTNAANRQNFNPAEGANAQLELTIIPEPSAALLGGLGALILLRRRRQAMA